MNTELHRHTSIVIVIFVLLVASALTFYWYMGRLDTPTNPEGAIRPAEQALTGESSTTNMESTIPVEEESVLEEAYTNPF